MRARWWVVGGAAILVSTWPTIALTQEVVVVADPPSCDCELFIEPWATLSDSDGRAGLSSPLALTRTRAGDFLVVPSVQQGSILLFDSAGSFVRQIGRPGGGPGEYLSVLALEPARGDSVAVLDPGNGRLTMIGPALNGIRTTPLPVRGGQISVLSDGRVLLLGGLARRGTARSDRLHLLGPSMELIRSFMPEPAQRPNQGLARRRMTATSGGMIAVGHVSDYIIEIWNSRGEHLRTLTRNPEWFPLGQEAGAVRAGAPAPPIPQLESPRLDTNGRLWTVSRIPDTNWTAALEQIRDLNGRTVVGLSQGTRDKYWDSMIEVIDPTTGLLLASTRVDPLVLFVLQDGFAASYREDQTGYPYIDIWRLELRYR